jgi:hypothetical protein
MIQERAEQVKYLALYISSFPTKTLKRVNCHRHLPSWSQLERNLPDLILVKRELLSNLTNSMGLFNIFPSFDSMAGLLYDKIKLSYRPSNQSELRVPCYLVF